METTASTNVRAMIAIAKGATESVLSGRTARRWRSLPLHEHFEMGVDPSMFSGIERHYLYLPYAAYSLGGRDRAHLDLVVWRSDGRPYSDWGEYAAMMTFSGSSELNIVSALDMQDGAVARQALARLQGVLEVVCSPAVDTEVASPLVRAAAHSLEFDI